MSVWTGDRIDALQRLLSLGQTRRRIASVLGISHNAVVGKARRLRDYSSNSPVTLPYVSCLDDGRFAYPMRRVEFSELDGVE